MDIDRIEGHGLAHGGARHLFGDPERDLVGLAGHEGLEGQARIERRTGQRVAARRLLRNRRRPRRLRRGLLDRLVMRHEGAAAPGR